MNSFEMVMKSQQISQDNEWSWLGKFISILTNQGCTDNESHHLGKPSIEETQPMITLDNHYRIYGSDHKNAAVLLPGFAINW